MDGEDFSIMFFPRSNGELVKTDVEEFDGTIACRYEDLVLMRFGPGEVVEGILSVEPE